jgi:class 3 adenylate cyclase
MDDVRAVMDDAGSETATVVGASEGGPLAMLFAAAHPNRTSRLILMGAEVRERKDDDWPWGDGTDEEFEEGMALLRGQWGQPGDGFMEVFAPSQESTQWLADWSARLQVNANTPGGAEAFFRMAFDIDVRDIAKSIQTPTLILHSVGDQVCHVENGRFLAREIPNSRYVELDGADHLPWFMPDPALSEIQEFLTGYRVSETPDRVLATVLLTDVVESTDTAAVLGDRRWREILETHNDIARSEIIRFRGKEVNTTGDGFLATFDGPARAIQCAHEVGRRTQPLGIEVRAGIHTGEVERIGDDIAGIAVHIASRIMAMANTGEVLTSSTVRDLVAGSGLEFEDRGTHQLRGVPGDWQILAAAP